MTDDPRPRLEMFLRTRRNDPSLTVVEYQPIVGGYSRAMARVWVEGDDGRLGYIVRADPPPGQAIIDTDRTTEWELLTALQSTGVIPMPTALWFDQTGDELGSPTIIIEMIEGDALISSGPGSPSRRTTRRWPSRWARSGPSSTRSTSAPCPTSWSGPTSWDEYIDARIERWVDGRGRARRRQPVHAARRQLVAGQQAARRPRSGSCTATSRSPTC